MSETKHRYRQWHTVFLLCAANAGCILLLVLFMTPMYGSANDVMIAGLVKASASPGALHLPQQSSVLTGLLGWLYKIQGQIPWYGICQYIFLWCAFTAVTYVVYKRAEKRTGLCIWAMLWICWGYQAVLRMEYAHTAAITFAAGVYLLFFYMTEKRRSAVLAICAVLLCAAGCMLNMNGIVQNVLHFAVQSTYQNQDLRVEESAYADAKERLSRIDWPSFKENEAWYQDLDVSSEAYRMWSKGDAADPEYLTVQMMDKITDAAAAYQKENMPFGIFLQKTMQENNDGSWFAGLILMLGIVLLWGRRSARNAAIVLCEAGAGLIMLYSCYDKGISPGNVPFYTITMCLYLVLSWIMQADEYAHTQQEHVSEDTHHVKSPALSRRGAVIFICCLVIMSQKSWKKQRRFAWQTNDGQTTWEYDVLRQMAEDPSNLYLVRTGAISWQEIGRPLHDVSQLADHVVRLGGAETASEKYADILMKYDVINPYRDMIGNENVYLVDRKIDQTLRYLRKYYDDSVSALEAGGAGDIKIYRIVGAMDDENEKQN